MNKILITGGVGFLGTNLASSYLDKAQPVIVFDNLSRPGVGYNLKWLKKNYSGRLLEFVKGDIRDSNQVQKLVKRAKVIFHFAGQTAVTTSVKNPKEDFEVNVGGTLNVLEAVRLNNPKAVVLFSSTNKVYGDLERLKITESASRYQVKKFAGIDETEPLDFYSPYGCSKGAADQYVRDYSRIYGLKTIVFRQSCIYGEHQFGVEDQGWLAHFVAKVIKDEKITIFGSGKQVRDVLHASDFVEVCLRAVKDYKTSSGQIYNIGGGVNNTISLLELISMLEHLSNKKIVTGFGKIRSGDQKIYISNIDKAKKQFGWIPKVGVEAGVKKLYEWMEEFLARK